MDAKRMENDENVALLEEVKRLLELGGHLDLAKKRIIGVYALGGAGGNILASLHAMGLKSLKNVETVAINSDEKVLEHLKDADKRVLIGTSMMEHPRGTAGDSKLARKMIEAARESLEVLVAQHQIIILLGSMGGGTGSELMIELSRMGTEMGKVVIAMPVLPFSAEGGRRAMAKRKMEKLESTDAIVIPLDNESLAKEERFRKLSMDRAFEALNRIIFRKIREIQDNTMESIMESIVEDIYMKIQSAPTYAQKPVHEENAPTEMPEIVIPQGVPSPLTASDKAVEQKEHNIPSNPPEIGNKPL
jgi:cell division GTPase FtsZ